MALHRKDLGMSYRDDVINEELMKRAEIQDLSKIVRTETSGSCAEVARRQTCKCSHELVTRRRQENNRSTRENLRFCKKRV